MKKGRLHQEAPRASAFTLERSEAKANRCELARLLVDDYSVTTAEVHNLRGAVIAVLVDFIIVLTSIFANSGRVAAAILLDAGVVAPPFLVNASVIVFAVLANRRRGIPISIILIDIPGISVAILTDRRRAPITP